MNKSQYTIPVNRTKFYRPPVSADYVSREALNVSLEQGVALPLTVVLAPAGYGKSSLVSHWLDIDDETDKTDVAYGYDGGFIGMHFGF